MKKQITASTDQNKVDLRRSSRNVAVNKLSKSRKRTTLTVTETQNTESLSLPEGQTAGKTTFKEISPIKKQLPVIVESPSPCQSKTKSLIINEKDSHGKNHDNLVTPKSNKTHSFTESTPFKEDLLACSQHFDPQSDVGWDCRSPDAINFLKRSRRRRHHSDVHVSCVSDIVTQLQVCKEGLKNEPPESSDTPLLGLWVNDESCWNGIQLQEKKRPVRERRRKDRSKSKAKGNAGEDVLSKDLVEKLQLVIEQCEGKEDRLHENTVDTKDQKRSASVGDESKDLFDLTSQGDRNKDYPSDSWSDDDLFENDSFIIKATQVENVPKGNKRKLDRKTSDEPPVKSGKYLDNQNRFTRLSAKPSPFKKHKSFNDRSEYEKSQQPSCTYIRSSNQQASKQFTSGLSHQNNISKSNGNSRPGVVSTQPCNNVNKSSTVISTISKSSHNNISKQSIPGTASATSTFKYSNVNNCRQSVPSSTKTSMSYNAKNGANSVSLVQNACITRPVSSYTRFGATSSRNTKFGANSSSNTRFGANAFSNTRFGANSSSNTRFGATSTCSQSVPSTKQASVNPSGYCSVTLSKTSTSNTHCYNSTQSFTNSTTRSHTALSSKPVSNIKSPNTGSSDKNYGIEKKSVTGVQTPGSRRSSGAFDMSLSDDILCQLVEPDEILDSQIPVSTNSKKTSHIDNALSFFHEEPKPKSEALAEKSTENMKSLNVKNAKTTTGFLSTKCANTFKSNPKQNSGGFQGYQPNSDKTTSCMNNKEKDVQKPCLSVKQEVMSHTGICNTSTTLTQSLSVNKPFINSRISIKKEPSVAQKPNVKVNSGPLDGTKAYSFKSTTVKTEPAGPIVKPMTQIKGHAMENASEDLFTSDDDDLSEPQLLALLDTVETSQINPGQPSALTVRHSHAELTSPSFRGKSRIDKKQMEIPTTFHETSQSNYDTNLCTLTPTKSDKSPFQCSPDDVDRKRQEALKRRRIVSGNTQTNPTTNKSNSSDKAWRSSRSSTQSIHKTQAHVSKSEIDTNPTKDNTSPLTCSQEEIEKKKRDALQRLHQKTSLNTQDDNRTSWDSSPFKCTPEMPSHSQSSNSPFKCSPEDIEKKRLAAISLKQQKTNAIKTNPQSGNNNKSPFQLTPIKSQTQLSPIACSPEDIEKKKQAALQRRQQKSETSINSKVQNANETVILKVSPNRGNIASKCKQLNFDAPSTKSESNNRTGVKGSSVFQNQSQQLGQAGSSSSCQKSESDKKVIIKKESPPKFSQAELIEQKKQAALQRRLEKMKGAQNLKKS